MGTWGHGFFENDAAQDFLEELPAKNISGYIETMITGDTQIEYLEYDTCIQILITGEIIAANLNRDYSRFLENIQKKLSNQDLKISAETIKTTIELIHRLRKQSEIRDLYLELDKLPLLDENIIDLLAKIE
jgi:hypothetical protein